MLFLECSCLQATAPTGEPLVAKCDLEGECYCQFFQGRYPVYSADKGCQLGGKICKLLVTRQRSTTWQSFFIKPLRWYFNELYENSLDLARDVETCYIERLQNRFGALRRPMDSTLYAVASEYSQLFLRRVLVMRTSRSSCSFLHVALKKG